MKRFFLTPLISTIVAACSPEPVVSDRFFEDVKKLCGKSYQGKLVSTDEVDAGFAAQPIVMYVEACGENEVRIPLHVGENRSRTWIVTRTDNGLQLKHDHRHEDGHADDVTMYGGDSSNSPDEHTYAFPADEYSKAMFDSEGIPDSKQNTWVIELDPESDLFAYQMSRPNRFFRLEFDLSQAVETPPPAWGKE